MSSNSLRQLRSALLWGVTDKDFAIGENPCLTKVGLCNNVDIPIAQCLEWLQDKTFNSLFCNNNKPT